MADIAVDAGVVAPRKASSAAAGIATTLCLAVIVVLAAAVRLAGIGEDSLWRDEAASWLQAHGSIADIIAATARDNYPPLHNLLLAGSMALFGDAEWALRLPSAILGIVNVVAIYWVGAMIGGRRAGLIATLLLALSAFHIWYSQEARMYALLSLTATLFAGSAIALARRSTWPRTLGVGLAGVALLYSHPYGAFVWLAVGIAVGVRISMRPQPGGATLKRWAVILAVSLVAFLPWAWVLLQRAAVIREKGFWIPFPTIPVIQTELGRWGSGALPLGFAGFAALVAVIRERTADPSWPASAAGRPPFLAFRPSPDAWVVIAWLVAPILIGLAVSLVANPVFIARYLIGSLPALFVLAGIGLARFATDRLSFVIVVALAAGVSWFGIAYSNQTPREDWRSASAWIAANFSEDGCVVVADAGPSRTIEYYRGRPLPCVLYDSAAVQYQASDVPSGRALAVLVSRRDAPIAPFDEAGWQRGEEVTFGVIRLVPLTRP